MKNYMLIATVILAFIACDRETDPLGPELNDIYGEFQVFEALQSSRNEVNFAAGQTMTFTARFSKTVDWELHVIGQTSGAHKLFRGKSKTVDASNANWNGTTTDLPMFKQEPCMAVLSVPEENFSDTLKNLNVLETRVIDGFVVADFESGINPDWNVFAQSGADMSFNIVASDSAPQQGNYYDMGGEVSWDYLIGLIDFPATAYGADVFPLSDNPNNVYFNVFLSKPESINNEIILFRFFEDENGDGVFQEASEDMYALELQGIKSQWHTVSVRYSDLVSLVNGQPASPNGNGVHEPHKLMQVSVLFLADPATGYSQTLMDNIIFTPNDSIQP